ncbi:carbohydrate esterase family 9 protein [Amylostereum chailletii]|nr:carbohydrate esterase family 9 protein [Amylostereum chailletii]
MHDVSQGRRRRHLSVYLFYVAGLTSFIILALTNSRAFNEDRPTSHPPVTASHTLSICEGLHSIPGPLSGFHERPISDRFEPGTKPTWIKNATIWTGRVQGLEVIHGDIFLDGGVIKAVGDVDELLLAQYEDITELDVQGAWVSPGIIDVHSHIGVGASPSLNGADDGNSWKGPILPWLRALDGLNTHDDGISLAVAGGLTTSLILPGSANAIGGQGAVIKLRPTKERSPSAMLLEPTVGTNSSAPAVSIGWKHMKHACARVYDDTRLDSVWAWRQAYDTARRLKQKQDAYCAKAQAGDWDSLGSFPSDIQWDPLVDILRGKVKASMVQTHCYEAVDLDNFVRLSNEFKFPIAAFHHAHEAYLVPDVLKRAYGPTPAVAIFSSFSGYKREAYRSTSFAARLLADEDIRVTMKSDHSAIVSRYLLHEAQQAHHYGLADYTALSSVTSTAAGVLGLDHRIGYIQEDAVVWDSHPLALGATPTQVFIDGIPQLDLVHGILKPPRSRAPPTVPDYNKEASDALEREGRPSLEDISSISGTMVFANVSSVWVRDAHGVKNLLGARGNFRFITVEAGRIVSTDLDNIYKAALARSDTVVVDLQGGSIAPALVAAGTLIGLQEIQGEPTTVDGSVLDRLVGDIPDMMETTAVHAIDGLQYASRDAILSYRAGVTTAVTAPTNIYGVELGIGVSLSLGVAHKLAKGAIIQPATSLFVTITHGSLASVSTQIATLRRLLLVKRPEGEFENWFGKVALGMTPLVVRVHAADTIASLLDLKTQVDSVTGAAMKLTLLGATEAHLLANELKEAEVGVLAAPRSFPYTWDSRRILAGPPLTEQGLVSYLLTHGVTVGLLPQGIRAWDPSMAGWAARNLRWDAGWVSSFIASETNITQEQALELASSNVDKLLGVKIRPADADLVATRGGDLLSFDSKVVAVISPKRAVVDVF